MIEGLGSAPSSTEPACIVRWVTPPASNPKPPPRAKLVAARLEQPGLALLREAHGLSCTEANALTSRPFVGQKLQRRPPPGTGAMDDALNKHGLLTEETALELVRLTNASRTKSGALAAEGRTARGRTALMPLAKRHSQRVDTSRWPARECIRLPRCLTFEMRGKHRLAGVCPLD